MVKFSKVYNAYLSESASVFSELYRTYLPWDKAAWCEEFQTYISIDDPRFLLFNETDEDDDIIIAEPWCKFDLYLPDLMHENNFIGLSKNGYLLSLIKINPKIKEELERLDYTLQRKLLKRYIGPKKLKDISIDNINDWSVRRYNPNKYKQFCGLHLIDFYVIGF